METFTISLPNYDFALPFNRESFIRMFPDSVITRTLELTKENDIPLINPLITPRILLPLQLISNTGYIPPLYESADMFQRALDYLGIDLPEVVYDINYPIFLRIYPNITTLDWNREYKSILAMAVQTGTPTLALYLFNHTDAKTHVQDDYDQFIELIQKSEMTPEDAEIAIMILRKRMIGEYLRTGLTPSGIIPVGLTFPNSTPKDLILEQGIPDLYIAYLETTNKSVTSDDMYALIEDIPRHPDSFEGYNYMIDYITLQLSPTSRRIRLFQQFFHDIVEGKITSNYKSALTSTPSRIDIYADIYLYIAVLLKHGNVFQEILNIIRQVCSSQSHLSNACNDIYNEFLTYVVAHPEVISSDMMELISENSTPDQKEYLRRGLSEKVSSLDLI